MNSISRLLSLSLSPNGACIVVVRMENGVERTTYLALPLDEVRTPPIAS